MAKVNSATINPTQEQQVVRHAGRIQRLKISIEKNKERGNVEKAESLQAELDRRVRALNDLQEAIKKALESANQ